LGKQFIIGRYGYLPYGVCRELPYFRDSPPRNESSACKKRMLGILRMLGESEAFASKNESLASKEQMLKNGCGI
jgi:hypothetical protein